MIILEMRSFQTLEEFNFARKYIENSQKFNFKMVLCFFMLKVKFISVKLFLYIPYCCDNVEISSTWCNWTEYGTVARYSISRVQGLVYPSRGCSFHISILRARKLQSLVEDSDSGLVFDSRGDIDGFDPECIRGIDRSCLAALPYPEMPRWKCDRIKQFVFCVVKLRGVFWIAKMVLRIVRAAFFLPRREFRFLSQDLLYSLLSILEHGLETLSLRNHDWSLRVGMTSVLPPPR